MTATSPADTPTPRALSLALAIGAFAALWLGGAGALGWEVVGIPLTIGKLVVAAWLLSRALNTSARPLLRWTAWSSGAVAVVAVTLASWLVSGLGSAGGLALARVAMLTVMAHLVAASVPRRELPRVLVGLAAVLLPLLAWSVLVQGAPRPVTGADHAWWARTSGLYDDANTWAISLLATMPPLLAHLVHRTERWSRGLVVALVALTPTAVLQSQSRAGMVVMLLVAPGVAWLLRHRIREALAGLAVALALVLWSMPLEATWTRWRALADPQVEHALGHGSLRERGELLGTGLGVAAAHPLLGVGPGNFSEAVSLASDGVVWKAPHNTWLGVAAELGLAGLVAWGLFLGSAARDLLRGWRGAEDDATADLRAGFALSLLACLAMSFTLDLATFAPGWFLGALALTSCRGRGGWEARSDVPVAGSDTAWEAAA